MLWFHGSEKGLGQFRLITLEGYLKKLQLKHLGDDACANFTRRDLHLDLTQLPGILKLHRSSERALFAIAREYVCEDGRLLFRGNDGIKFMEAFAENLVGSLKITTADKSGDFLQIGKVVFAMHNFAS
jgi:hypothetical protein